MDFKIGDKTSRQLVDVLESQLNVAERELKDLRRRATAEHVEAAVLDAQREIDLQLTIMANAYKGRMTAEKAIPELAAKVIRLRRQLQNEAARTEAARLLALQAQLTGLTDRVGSVPNKGH